MGKRIAKPLEYFQIFFILLGVLIVIFKSFCKFMIFSFYGLGLWLPEIFSRFEEHSVMFPNKSDTFCEIQNNLNNYTTTVMHNSDCYGGMDSMVFLNTIIMGICCCFGNIISSYMAGRVDRRILPVVTMLMGAISAVLIQCLNSENQLLIVASVFQAAMSTSNNAINSVVVDLFPTKLKYENFVWNYLVVE